MNFDLEEDITQYLNMNNLFLVYMGSIVTGILVLIVSIIGIIFSSEIYPTDDIVNAYVPTDVINLVIALPILFLCIWHTRRGLLLGLLALPGSLLYFTYIYTNYIIGAEFTDLFVIHLLIVTISLYTLILIFSIFKHQEIREHLRDKIPEKKIGALLLGISLIFLLRQFVVMFQAIIDNEIIDNLRIAEWFGDFVIFGTVLLISGSLLFRSHAIGYSSSTGVMITTIIAFLGLVPFLIVQAYMASEAIDWTGIIVVLLFGMIVLVPFYWYYIRQ